tara:strand:- start:1323 stop:1688 length:366 start_codon:yes stop_codon:yes gene_type:complete
MAKWATSKNTKEATRGDILDTAKEYVTKDRASDHGDMEDNFKMIADFWSTYLGVDVKPHDVGVMMNLLKVARIKSNPKHPDNWVDGAGYMACGGELASKRKRTKMPPLDANGRFQKHEEEL